MLSVELLLYEYWRKDGVPLLSIPRQLEIGLAWRCHARNIAVSSLMIIVNVVYRI